MAQFETVNDLLSDEDDRVVLRRLMDDHLVADCSTADVEDSCSLSGTSDGVHKPAAGADSTLQDLFLMCRMNAESSPRHASAVSCKRYRPKVSATFSGVARGGGRDVRVHEIRKKSQKFILNPLMGTLKPQNNGPLYSNTVIGTLAVDGWTVTFGTAKKGLGGLHPALSPPRCTKCNSTPINGKLAYRLHIIQCDTIITFAL